MNQERTGQTAPVARAALLSLSLLLNAYLALQLASPNTFHRSPVQRSPAQLEKAPPARNDQLIAATEADAALDWRTLENLDFQTLRVELVRSGCPEHLVKAMLGVHFTSEFIPKMLDLFMQSRGNFWDHAVLVKSGRKPTETPEQMKAREALHALSREHESLIEEFVEGGQGAKGGEEIDPRVDFLPPEKRLLIHQQQQAVNELRASLRRLGSPEKDIAQQVKELEAQHASARDQFLSLEENDEFRLRNSRFAHVVQNLYAFDPTLEERKGIIELHEKHDGKMPEDALAKLLGEERAAQFHRARDQAYEGIHKFGAELNLPESALHSLYALKQQAEAQAKRLQQRQDLRRAERDQLLRDLKESTLASVARQIGPENASLYLKNDGWWINAIAPGK